MGVPEEELLQWNCRLQIADCRLETKRAGAQPADGAGGDFQDEDLRRLS